MEKIKEDLDGDLVNLPQLIREKRFELVDYSKKVNHHESHKSRIESFTMSAVANEKEEGKKKYPNEDSRKHELNSRLRVNEEFKEHKEKVEHNTTLLKEGEIVLDFLRNKFSASKYRVKLLVGVPE